MIDEARHRGSVPPDVHRRIKEAQKQEGFEFHIDEVQHCRDEHEGVRLNLASGKSLVFDRVFLATGFKKDRPGGALVEELIHTASLECADCGFPIVDTHLRWHPRIFVSGALAELEIGPVARNIAGARRAGDRLAAHLDKLPA